MRGCGGADGIAERHESLHSVRGVRPRPSVRREKLVREGRAGRQFSQAGMPDASSFLSPFLFLPLVAIVILIRHSNNDSLAANWPKERSGAGG